MHSPFTKFVVALAILLVTVTSVVAQDNSEPYVIGIVIGFEDQSIIDEMTSLGYIEGQNVTYMSLSFENVAPEQFADSYSAQIQAMIDAPVDVFVTNTDTDAVNLQALTGGSIPTVFARSDDPVSTGAVADLVFPGGMMTGTITNRPHERRLQILTEVLPTTDKILYLYSPLTGEAEVVLQQVQAIALQLGIEVIPALTPDAETAITALQNIPEGVDWFFLTPFVPFDQSFYQALYDTAAAHRIGIAGVTDSPVQNYLVGYGPSINESNRQAARIVDRILRGASPAELPVEIAENYLMINLEAAEAIEMEIPLGVLRQATTIIRPGFFDQPTTDGG